MYMQTLDAKLTIRNKSKLCGECFLDVPRLCPTDMCVLLLSLIEY